MRDFLQFCYLIPGSWREHKFGCGLYFVCSSIFNRLFYISKLSALQPHSQIKISEIALIALVKWECSKCNNLWTTTIFEGHSNGFKRALLELFHKLYSRVCFDVILLSNPLSIPHFIDVIKHVSAYFFIMQFDSNFLLFIWLLNVVLVCKCRFASKSQDRFSVTWYRCITRDWGIIDWFRIANLPQVC